MKYGTAALLLLLCACSAKHGGSATATATNAPSPTASPMPPIKISSHGNPHQPIRIVEQVGNRKLYEILARSTESTLQSQTQFRGSFSDTHVTFYAPDGALLAGAAPLTTVDRTTQTVSMSGGVHARTSDGVLLDCDQLQYDRRTGLIHGVGNVQIHNHGDVLTGGSFDSDLHLSHLHME